MSLERWLTGTKEEPRLRQSTRQKGSIGPKPSQPAPGSAPEREASAAQEQCFRRTLDYYIEASRAKPLTGFLGQSQSLSLSAQEREQKG